MLNEEDIKKLYTWIGETNESLKNIDISNKDGRKDFNDHREKEAIDTQEIKDGLTEIRNKVEQGIICPYEEEIGDIKDECQRSKGERKYIYGGIAGCYLFLSTIAKKLWGG